MVAAGERARAPVAGARLPVREAARLARTASPSAPPIMNAVFTIPDARPDSLGSTSLIAASSTGLNAIPPPTPSRIMLGSTSTTKLPSTGARANSSSPAAASSSPAPSGCRMPKRITIFADSPSEKSAHDEVRGQEREPDLSGL